MSFSSYKVNAHTIPGPPQVTVSSVQAPSDVSMSSERLIWTNDYTVRRWEGHMRAVFL